MSQLILMQFVLFEQKYHNVVLDLSGTVKELLPTFVICSDSATKFALATQLNDDLIFTILDDSNGLIGEFKITKTILGNQILIYESVEADATYGWFDPVVEVIRELHASN